VKDSDIPHQSGQGAGWKGSGWGGLLGLVLGVSLAWGVAVLSYNVMPSSRSSEGLVGVFDLIARKIVATISGGILGMLVGAYCWFYTTSLNLKSAARIFGTATVLSCILSLCLLYWSIPAPPERLNLANTQVTDAGLKKLKELKSLRAL